METEKEHLAWAKKRALELMDQGDPRKAFLSLLSDLRKHEHTKTHPMLTLGPQLFDGGHLDSPVEMRKFIEGF